VPTFNYTRAPPLAPGRAARDERSPATHDGKNGGAARLSIDRSRAGNADLGPIVDEENSMRRIPSVVALLAVLSISVVGEQPARAELSINGTLPPGTATVVLIQANHQKGGANRVIKFKFSAPAPAPGGYALSYCIGPAQNPCGLQTSYVVNVPAAEERLAVVDASIFVNNVLVVGQGTSTPVQYAVSME
jgi:hypothetical protein